MKNILVTGGAGYIGSHIIELLIKKKFNAFIIDNLSTGHKKLINKKAKFFNVDLKQFHNLSSSNSRTDKILAMDSPGCKFNKLAIDFPFAVRLTSGIENTRNQWTLPKLVNISK